MGARRTRGVTAAALCAVLSGVAAGCGGDDRRAGPAVGAPTVPSAAQAPASETPSEPTIDWADRVAPAAKAAAPRRPVRPAVMSDASEGSDALVTARRLVYRVGFVVPPGYRHPAASLIPSAAELEVDVSRDRLRARFVGNGWPLPRGVELRLRADLPGVYVFDAEGGRSLGPGELASWFEGRTSGSRSRVRVRREASTETSGPSEPMCLLLAEWTAQPREDLVRRCSEGSIPPAFGFGPWRGELTAMVPMQLPRRALRADHVDPPESFAPATGGTMLGSEELRGLASSAAGPASHGTLEVVNHAESRVIVFVAGTPVAWVDAGARTTIERLPVGTHRVGALRPLGIAQATPRATTVPGTFTLGRPPKAADDE